MNINLDATDKHLNATDKDIEKALRPEDFMNLQDRKL